MPRHQKPIAKKNALPMWMFAGAAVLLLVAIALVLLQGGESGPGQIGPRLTLNTEKVDLGKQLFDKTVRAQFSITNTGDRTLTLDASTPIRVVEGC